MVNWLDYYKYDEATGNLISLYTGKPLCNEDRDGYVRVRRDGKEFRAHRIIWEIFHGPIPDGMLVDHKDGNVRNNRIENLRLATRTQNNANRVKQDFSCLPKGVAKVGNKFRARITRNSKTISLGTFNTAEEAGEAYARAAEDFDGEFFCSR